MRARMGVLGGVLALVWALLPVWASPSAATPTTPSTVPVTISKQMSRIHLENGKDVVADERTVTVSVDETSGLHDRQVVVVDWKGAHPTFNQVLDVNSAAAADEEYPMVLLECRGVDSPTAPVAQRLRPETCWTQTPVERYLSSPSVHFPPWRVDRYAAASARQRSVGVPQPLPAACFASSYPEHWLHFVSAAGIDYPGGRGGCGGIAPEQTSGGSTTAALPGNTTYGYTQPNGTGQARFVVWNSQTNASLGCGPTVACSLVAVPIEGISCDVAAANLPAADRPVGQDATDALSTCTAQGNESVPDEAVAGKLWWSASNWRNRITVPLGFAPLPVTNCSGTTGQGIQVYGSELMTAATSQWNSKFCGDPHLFPVTHVQTGETQARNLLSTGNTDAAFTVTAPSGGYGSPVVSAPTAMTGFAIGFDIDDAHQRAVTELRLTPRLLAKLLTESYPAINDVRQGWADTPNAQTKIDYRPLAQNPLNIAADPEFIALNPGISHDVANSFGASTLLTLSSDSDVTRALTAYIDADPEARAWLDGTPDPWGMVVNPNYKGIALPVDSWPLLDTFEPLAIYDDRNPCLQQDPVPYLPLVASPQNRLAAITLDLQYGLQQSQVVCSGVGTSNPKLVATGAETIGYRFMIGVTSLADAAQYRIATASLQTRSTASTTQPFTDATGRTFVTPDDTSLRAAAALLTPDTSADTWTMPYDRLVGPAGSTTAYPGALLVSTAVPTKGLPALEAAQYGTFLDFVGGQGQTPGSGAGELPAGYLPLTDANGLGAERAYTRAAATFVHVQNGEVPSLTAPRPVPTTTPAPAPSTSTPRPLPSGTSSSPARTPSAGDGTTPPPVPAQGTVLPSAALPSGGAPLASGSTAPTTTSPAAVPSSGAPNLVEAGVTQRVSAGLAGGALPLLTLLALAAGVVIPLRFGPRPRRG